MVYSYDDIFKKLSWIYFLFCFIFIGIIKFIEDDDDFDDGFDNNEFVIRSY